MLNISRYILVFSIILKKLYIRSGLYSIIYKKSLRALKLKPNFAIVFLKLYCFILFKTIEFFPL